MKLIKPESVGISSSRLNRVHELTSSYIDRGSLAGIVSLVSRRGQLVHFEAQGKMSLETGTSMQEDSIFRIYSMTKQITSIAAMILYERGSFQLDTPITKFIPEFENMEVFQSGTATDYKTIKADRDITVADLLRHTSGLTYGFLNATPLDELYRKEKIDPFYRKMSLSDFIKKLSHMPLLFSPGTRWNYSVSTDVLGYLIEIISGMSLDAFFKKEIYEPLGMIDTDFFVPPEKQNRFTAHYMHKSGVPPEKLQKFSGKKLFLIDDSNMGFYTERPKLLSGGGGLVSTASDILKFATMLLNKGKVNNEYIVSPKTIELMTTNNLPGDISSFCSTYLGPITDPGIGFGLGFYVTEDLAMANIIGNKGEYYWTGAAHTAAFVDPKEELIAIVLTQAFPIGYFSIRRQFKQAVYQSLIEK